MEIHHKSGDTYDKVDVIDFKAGEAIVAKTAWGIVNSEKPNVPRFNHAEVAKFVGSAALLRVLKSRT